MKSKIKLTDLSRLDSLNDEMDHLKGGDSEEGPFCWGCKCSCECSTQNVADTNATNNHNSARNNGNSSWGSDIGIIPMVSVINF
jgi:natural product precursor